MNNIVKLVIFTPPSHADQIREAMGKAGAGKIGNYSFCTFSSPGFSRFKPESGSNPTIGDVGILEVVEEERIETVCSKELLANVIEAIKSVHPYEEAPIDIYPIELIETI